jgi:hypothetical protein
MREAFNDLFAKRGKPPIMLRGRGAVVAARLAFVVVILALALWPARRELMTVMSF